MPAHMPSHHIVTESFIQGQRMEAIRRWQANQALQEPSHETPFNLDHYFASSESTCSYILKEGDFCQQSRAKRSSYCHDHHRLCHEKKKPPINIKSIMHSRPSPFTPTPVRISRFFSIEVDD